MNTWGTVTWDIARSGGFTAYILLSLSVILGLALTLHWQAPRWPRLINSEMHNFITLLSLIFTSIHVLAVWLDPFTHFGWSEVLLPFTSHYRPLWMALGIVALYLGLAVGLSTWLRPWIGYSWWRKLHVLTLVTFLLVTIHGIATGSDTRTWWGVAIYGGSILTISSLLWIRLINPANKQSRAHPFFAGLTLFIALIGSFLTILGPLQSGWNAFANNGNGSGGLSSTTTSAVTAHQSTQTSSAFTSPFSSQLQGTMTQNGSNQDDSNQNGSVSLQFDLILSQGASGKLQILLQGQAADDGGLAITSSHIALGTNATTALYAGPLINLSEDSTLHMTAQLTSIGTTNTAPLNVQIDLNIQNPGQVTGTISGHA